MYSMFWHKLIIIKSLTNKLLGLWELFLLNLLQSSKCFSISWRYRHRRPQPCTDGHDYGPVARVQAKQLRRPGRRWHWWILHVIHVTYVPRMIHVLHVLHALRGINALHVVYLLSVVHVIYVLHVLHEVTITCVILSTGPRRSKHKTITLKAPPSLYYSWHNFWVSANIK